jgi:hypothetical protein
MYQDEIKEFGQRLVVHCRDRAIWGCNLCLRPDHQAVDSKRWRAAAAEAGGIVPATIVIPEAVDAGLAHILGAIDHSEVHKLLCLSFTTERGEFVYLPVDGLGEMCGWYGGEPSWRSWYSKERIVDAEDFDISALKAEWGTQDLPDDPAPNLDDLEMPRRAIEELGILLVRHVRDVAIQSCDLQLLPHSQTAMAQRWRKAALPHNGKVPPEILIPDCVDETIFTFLRAIDQGLLLLSFTAENGEMVDLVKDGQGKLADEYIRPGGWRDQFSKERINQD